MEGLLEIMGFTGTYLYGCSDSQHPHHRQLRVFSKIIRHKIQPTIHKEILLNPCAMPNRMARCLKLQLPGGRATGVGTCLESCVLVVSKH